MLQEHKNVARTYFQTSLHTYYDEHKKRFSAVLHKLYNEHIVRKLIEKMHYRKTKMRKFWIFLWNENEMTTNKLEHNVLESERALRVLLLAKAVCQDGQKWSDTKLDWNRIELRRTHLIKCEKHAGKWNWMSGGGGVEVVKRAESYLTTSETFLRKWQQYYKLMRLFSFVCVKRWASKNENMQRVKSL